MKTINIKKIAILPVLAMAFVAAFFQFHNASARVESAWGPQDRATYTWDNPADHVTFNSITDNPFIGDERNFVRIRKVGDEGYNSDSVDIEVGQEYEVYIYYHNDASGSLNASGEGMALDVYMRTEFPSYLNSGESAVVAGFISSSNAQPGEIWDIARLNAHTPVYLNYVANSAVLHNGGTADGALINGDALRSEQGATLAYWNDLWGMIPGCNEYAGYLTYRIKADQPNFVLDKKVALGETSNDYKDEIIVSPGDTLNFKIGYQNTGTTEQNNVTLHDLLPDGLKYIDGSTWAGSTRHPEGSKAPEYLFTDGLNVGAMIPGEESWATYQAKVADDKNIFPCGDTEIYNSAYVATYDGKASDRTKITVHRECENNENGNTVNQLPNTGPGEIAMAIAIVVVIGGGGFYFYRSQKMLRKVATTAGGTDGATGMVNSVKSGKDIVLEGIKNDKKHE